MGIVKKRNKRYSKDVNSINTSLVNSTFIFPTVKLRNLDLKSTLKIILFMILCISGLKL